MGASSNKRRRRKRRTGAGRDSERMAHLLHRVELEGAKDPSELHLQDPGSFKKSLRAAFKGAKRWADEARAEAVAKDRKAWQACEVLAREGRILDRFAETLERSGVAGESRILKLLYLALTSLLLKKPVSVAVKGPSSGGKSYLTESVLCFFPESAYHALTAMSERTLAYSEEPIKHRFLVIYEAEGMASDFATYLIRSLLSEGRSVKCSRKATEALKRHRARQNEERFGMGSLWLDNHFVFPTITGTTMSGTNLLGRHFKPLLKRAELPPIRLHDLRHTCATILLMAGKHPKYVQELLGHASISITLDTYSNVIEGMDGGLADAMDEAL